MVSAVDHHDAVAAVRAQHVRIRAHHERHRVGKPQDAELRELCTRGSRPRERAAKRHARERRGLTQQLAARGIGDDLRHERSSNNHVVFASSSNSTSDAAANTQNRIMITLRVA